MPLPTCEGGAPTIMAKEVVRKASREIPPGYYHDHQNNRTVKVVHVVWGEDGNAPIVVYMHDDIPPTYSTLANFTQEIQKENYKGPRFIYLPDNPNKA